MSEVEVARGQLADDAALLMGCAIYCVFLAPFIVRLVCPIGLRCASWVRDRRDGSRGGGGVVAAWGALRRLDEAVEAFQLPFTCRQTVRDRLLEGWVMAGTTVVFVGVPMLVPFARATHDVQALTASEQGGADGALAVAFVVLVFFLGAVGGAARFFSPRLEIPAVRSACNALITAHGVHRGRATSKQLDAAVSGLSRILVHRAQKDERRWLRAEMTVHARRVRETLRAGSRELLTDGTPAAAALARELGKILHGLSATTYEMLLDEEDLVPRSERAEPPRRQAALLMGTGIVAAVGLAWALSVLGLPEEVTVVVALLALAAPAHLWGSPGSARVRDLLRLVLGDPGQTPADPPPPSQSTARDTQS
ncbi:hypothetical protein ACSCB1_38395 [Streptomyces europaeiscabiei]|uniref:hypothetical protein n=1 Tax=Streptomyces TaxID=1883 RepID=UPI0006286A2D|nr:MULTISPECIES: hypothetical protein [Streptomyces]